MKLRPSKSLTTSFLGAAALVLLLPVAMAQSGHLNVAVDSAPVAPDGTTAGALTDFVLTFADLDPAVDGIRLQRGATIEIVLADEFTPVDTGVTPPNNVAVLQGWPQSPRVPFPYTITLDGNKVTLTVTETWKPGDVGPGAKQVHLILLGYFNPVTAGVYPVELTINPNPAGKGTLSGVGYVEIIPDARPSVNPISLFSGPPGPPPPFFNPFYQTVALGDSARQVGLYLWGANSAAALGVDLVGTSNPSYYQLADNGATVGEVLITAPEGAQNYSLASVGLGVMAAPSIQISAFVTGVPVGLLGIQFTPDPAMPGDYAIKIRMFGGNEKTLFVTAQ